MSDGESVKGDPNPTRLLQLVMDKLDKVLVHEGFEFRDDRDWEDACGSMEKFIFRFYDDLTGGDEEYDPKKHALLSSSSDVEVEGEVSSDEDEEEIDALCEEEDSEEGSPKAKKQRK
jgi:hypothetical protein